MILLSVHVHVEKVAIKRNLGIFCLPMCVGACVGLFYNNYLLSCPIEAVEPLFYDAMKHHYRVIVLSR